MENKYKATALYISPQQHCSQELDGGTSPTDPPANEWTNKTLDVHTVAFSFSMRSVSLRLASILYIIAEDDLGLLTFLVPLLGTGITGVHHHAQFMPGNQMHARIAPAN